MRPNRDYQPHRNYTNQNNRKREYDNIHCTINYHEPKVVPRYDFNTSGINLPILAFGQFPKKRNRQRKTPVPKRHGRSLESIYNITFEQIEHIMEMHRANFSTSVIANITGRSNDRVLEIIKRMLPRPSKEGCKSVIVKQHE